MKKLSCAGCCLLVVAFSVTARGGEPCCAGVIQECRTVDRVSLNAVLTEKKYTVEVPFKKGYTVQAKDVASEVPCTRMVSMCVKDPRTGQIRTECVPQTVMQKVITTYIVVLSPDSPNGTRTEQRSKKCLEVSIGHAPVKVIEQVPLYCSGTKCR